MADRPLAQSVTRTFENAENLRILRVFNNNVVLAQDGTTDIAPGGEVVLTGRGLGFKAHPGDAVDPRKIVKVFVPTDGRDPDHIAQMLAGIPPEMVQIASESLAAIGQSRIADSSPSLVVALADHINGARMMEAKGAHVEYPLRAEVENLYPVEYSQAKEFLAQVNSRLDTPLRDEEAVAFALHLVNAGFSSGDLSYTYQMTGVIEQVLSIIEKRFDVSLDKGSVNVARFITHMRYLFVRIHQGKQLECEPSAIVAAIRESFPEAMQCAGECAAVIELRFGADISEDELSYMALHVARVAGDARDAAHGTR